VNVFGQILADREQRAQDEAAADERWLVAAGVDPVERLQLWDRWVRAKLLELLTWPEDEAKRKRMVSQFAEELTALAKQLRGRGWLLDSRELAVHVRAILEPVGRAQRAGKVSDSWSYFCAAVRRYVDANADAIQAHARRTGGEESGQTIGAILGGLSVVRRMSMTELLTTREGQIEAAAIEREQMLRNRKGRPVGRAAAKLKRKITEGQEELF
jgi:hypothetical protein